MLRIKVLWHLHCCPIAVLCCDPCASTRAKFDAKPKIGSCRYRIGLAHSLVLKAGHFPLPIIVSANADGSQGNSRTLSAFLWQAECVILAGK